MLFALTAATSCSDDDDYTPDQIVISLESGLTDPDQSDVEFETITTTGYINETYNNVLTGKTFASTESVDKLNENYEDTGTDVNSQVFDDILLEYSDGSTTFSFGSYYSDGQQYYSPSEYIAGFTLSKNYKAERAQDSFSSPDYKYQFSVYASSGADGSDTFLTAYSDAYTSTYSLPTIELSEAKTLKSIYFANSTITASYDHTYSFYVTVTGYNNGSVVSYKDVELTDNSYNAIEGWFKVNFNFSNVDMVTFTTKSEDSWAPSYFCIDSITFE